jgi:hypothetical protein
MVSLIFRGLKDEKLMPGVAGALIPKFSGTTLDDEVALRVALMSLVKDRVTFSCSTLCGLTALELEGSVEDWVALRNVVDAIEAIMGKEFCEEYALKLYGLKETLDRLVQIRSAGAATGLEEWLQQIVSHTVGSGMDHVSGWIRTWFGWGRMVKRPRPGGGSGAKMARESSR